MAATPAESGAMRNSSGRDKKMSVDRAVMAFAGSMILLSLVLSFFSPWWLLLAAFVGLNLIQASLTGFCPAARLFKRFGLPVGAAFP